MIPLEQLRAVLCDPSGRCCIRGSDEDRKIVDDALAQLASGQEICRSQMRTTIASSKTIMDLKAQLARGMEPFDDYPEFHESGMGCGLEDRDIHDRYDRYEAMRYGWDQAIEKMAHRLDNYTHPAPAQQPLGIEEIQKLAADNATGGFLGPLTFARAIEAAHGIKEKP